MKQDILYKRYGIRSYTEIKNYLKNIKIVVPVSYLDEKNEMMNDKYFELTKDNMDKIIKDPRGISFTFSSELDEENNLDLTIFKTIPFLVKSSSRFFLKPDIGEVFDQIDDDDINQISAIYVDSENHKTINSEGDHFLMEAVLLTNVKKIRKKKLKKLNGPI